MNNAYDAPPLRIFPTAHKDKHANTLGYPVGAEAMSQALSSTAQAVTFEVSFYAGNQFLKGTPPVFPVLSVSYRKRPRSFFDGKSANESGVLDPKWTLTIYTVPREMKHAIKSQLLDEIVPAQVLPWLKSREALTGRIAHHSLWIEYRSVENGLAAHEQIHTEPERA